MSFVLRPLLLKLHLYVAVAVGVYVAILGVTGAILAFRTELDHLAHAKLAYVKPVPPRLSFAELGEAVTKVYPGQKIFGYNMGEAPNLSTLVVVGSMPDSRDIVVYDVYVNPYTGQILGSRTNGPNVLSMISAIHTRLAPPRPGHGRLAISFVKWITVAALIVLLSGIWLWWPQMRFGIGAGGGRPFWYDLHVTSGIVAAAFLVLLAVSGIVMGFGNASLLYALTGSKPTVQPRIATRPHNATKAIPIDRAFAIGGQALPGATPFAIFGPTAQGTYIVNARTPHDHDPAARSEVIIDQYTGTVLYTEVADKAPAGKRLWDLNRAIHFGVIFGIPSKAIVSLASLLVTLQVVSGTVMWIKRVRFRSMIPALVATAAVTAIAVYTVLAPTRL